MSVRILIDLAHNCSLRVSELRISTIKGKFSVNLLIIKTIKQTESSQRLQTRAEITKDLKMENIAFNVNSNFVPAAHGTHDPKLTVMASPSTDLSAKSI